MRACSGGNDSPRSIRIAQYARKKAERSSEAQFRSVFVFRHSNENFTKSAAGLKLHIHATMHQHATGQSLKT